MNVSTSTYRDFFILGNTPRKNATAEKKSCRRGLEYVYQYKDHLGNVRLSYTDNNNDGVITPSSEIIEESNYYPFGLKHKGYNGNYSPIGNATAEKFGYNGTEFEEVFNINLYEMPLRRYDPAIARWTSIDPITHHSNSTYNGYDNNPIIFADPSGGDVIIKDGGNSITYTGDDAVTAFNMFTGGYQDPDAKEVVKNARNTFKKLRKADSKFKKGFKAIDGFYSLGDGATPEDQVKALQDVYNSLSGFLPRSVSFKVFAQYYDTYLAMVNYELKIIEQGLREYSKVFDRYASQSSTTSDLPMPYAGGFAGGIAVYRYMQQIKLKKGNGKSGGDIVNINNKVINFVYEYQKIIQFTTGQTIPSMYAAPETPFKIYARFRGAGSDLDYQTARYFLSNFDAIEKMLYGGLKVKTD